MKTIAKEFQHKWQFPQCLGAVDGKHIAIIPPAGSGSNFYNYKGYHSIVLMAICNANYEFTYVDVGTNGRISDGGVLRKTTFFRLLDRGSLKIPTPEKPSDNADDLPFVYIGDEAFALRPDFLKPYPQRNLNGSQRIFNYRLCRARRIIENTFGILAARFRIFHSPINMKLQHINTVVLACCVLHNYLRRKATNAYTILDDHDKENHETGQIVPGLRANDILFPLSSTVRNYSNDAKRVREKFEEYFNTSGAVPWQNRMM